MEQLSSQLLLLAFILYTVATIVFAVSITGEASEAKKKDYKRKWGRMGFLLTVFGLVSQLGYFFTRWVAAGHIPVSDMFEFMTFFSMTIVFAFIIIYLIYRANVLGVIALPIAVIMIGYASAFPMEVEPLIPALQSYWLRIHVTTTALGEGILTISFVAGLIYLIRAVDQTKASKRTFWLEFVMFSLLSTIAFILVSLLFRTLDYSTAFQWVNERGNQAKLLYNMPAIAGPYEGKMLSDGFGPLFQAPSWMNGAEAPRKLNTMIWSLVCGAVLYGAFRMIIRKRIVAFIQPLFKNVNLQLVDEMSYRAVSIGFPVFTLGGIIFAGIWAQIAWTRFWGWDPKEVWALITVLFYATYLHLRLSKGWHSERSAWLSVIGFVVIMFNLIVVNLIIAGLHSYA